MKWQPFDKALGSSQKLPEEGKIVFVLTAERYEVIDIGHPVHGLGCGTPGAIALAYMKFAAGDRSCPYFVIVGVGGDAVAWNDCVPECLGTHPWLEAGSVLAE